MSTPGTPIPQGATEPIEALILDESLDPLTGKSDILVWIRRKSDGLTYDWNDSTFKAYASCGAPRQTMTEVDSTNYPGQYARNWTSPSADDVYEVTVDQSPGTDAANVPQVGEIRVGGWVDDIAAILLDTDAIDSRLPSDPADESLQQTSHTATQGVIAALNDLSQADVQSAMTSQGYTTVRAPNLDNLDATVSSRATPTQVKTQADQALVDYDPPTAAELDAVEDNIRGADNRDLSELAGATWAAPGDTLEGIKDAIGSGGLTAQQVRDAMKLAPTGGAPAAGSVDEHLDTIEADTAAIEPLVTANLDAAVSSRATPGDAMTLTAGERTAIDAELTGAHGAGSWQQAAGVADWTTAEKNQIRFRLAMDGPQTDPTTGLGTLEDILADTDAIDTRLPSDPADESNQLLQHSITQAAVAGLNDLDQAGVQAAMTAQGYTAARAPGLDLLDAAISSRAVAGDAMTLTVAERAAIEAVLAAIHGAGSWETATPTVDWTTAEKEAIREALGVPGTKAGATGGQLQDVLADTAAIDGRLPTDPADESNQNANHNTTQGVIAALNDLDQAGVQAALTAQGYTSGRALLLDLLDVAISTRAIAGDAMALVANALDSTALAASAATEIANEVESVQAGIHGAGSWETGAPGTGDWTGGEKEQIRDALGVTGAKTTAVGGQLQDVKTAVEAVDTRLPADPADESNQLAQHAQTQADIAALENLSSAQVAAVFNSQGYTTARASGLDDTKAAAEAVDARLPTDPADESNQLAAHAQTQADIAALENLSQAEAAAAAAAALASYDPPTKAELDAAEAALTAEHNTTQAAIAELNDIQASDVLVVKQTYVYDVNGDQLVGMVWVEDGSGQIVTPTSVSVDIRDVDDALQFTMIDAGPDGSGFFKLVQAAPGLVAGSVYKAKATVQVPVIGALTSGYGIFTIG